MTHKTHPDAYDKSIPEGAEDDPDWPRYPSGDPMPPTHPDHGPMKDIPRNRDGSISAYYYCSKKEVEDYGLGSPPRRHRHDGWTDERIEQFLEALGSSASVKDACQIVGMSRQSAYNLYNRPENADIRKAWDEALRACTNILATTAFDRAVNGTEEQVFYQGQFVGWRDKYDNRHLQWMLRARDPLNWAPLHELEGWLRQRGIEGREVERVLEQRKAGAEPCVEEESTDLPRLSADREGAKAGRG